MNLHLVFLAGLLGCVACAPSRQLEPMGNSPADFRAEQTLEQMTLDERLSILRGYMPLALVPRPADAVAGAGYVPGVPRLGVPALTETDASLGVSNMGGILRRGDVATALPSGAAMASTWDTELIERGGAMIGAEARAKGFNVLLAGGANLVREPRNGRNFEYLGEDPLLAGRLAGHAIRGIQSNNIISTVKHYAFNAQETGRTALSVEVDEATLRESDLLAFEIAIEVGDPGSVMCAYNRINGDYACENKFLLNDVLRRDWGYRGFVMSDWGAVHGPSIREGLDQESGSLRPNPPYFGALLRAELAAGRVTEEDINRSARRILRSIYAFGLADHPVQRGMPIDYDANARIAQDVAEAGIVLLKNNADLLPIASSARRILLVGGHADVGVPSGGGSSQVNPVGGNAVPPKGGRSSFTTPVWAKSAPLEALREILPNARISYDDGADLRRAAAAARGADLVVVFAVQPTTESSDVTTLSLPNNQDDLIAAIAAANARTAVVLETGGAVFMPWINNVGAVLAAWYPGQRGGHAIARVLTGQVNPSGRLPITFPATIDQTPNPVLPGSKTTTSPSGETVYDLPTNPEPFDVFYPEGADVGYRWYDRTHAKTLFAFGHGLSYTQFHYAALEVTGGTNVTASFDITNAGERAGIEVAQVYVRVGGVRRLIGWSRTELAPGETKRVTVTAEPRILADFDVRNQTWRIAAGAYPVEVSAAANAPRLHGEAQLKPQQFKP